MALERLLESALGYVSRGWRVFPAHSMRDGCCTCGEQKCEHPGKHPRTLRGCKDASSDPGEIRRWWARWPDANIAIATGAVSGLIVLDVDPRSGGDASLEEVEVPPTLTALTGGGGRHFYFDLPRGEVRKNRVGFRPGLDVRADGGCVIAPPSLHASGGRYEWITQDGQSAPEPAWLAGVAKPSPTPSAIGRGPVASAGEHVMRARRYIERMPPAIQGSNGSGALMAVAGTLAAWERAGRLSEADSRELLAEYNERAVPPWTEQAELDRALTNARQAARKEPPADRSLPLAARSIRGARTSTPSPADTEEPGSGDGDGSGSAVKPTIVVGSDIAEVVDRTIEAMASTEVYQRGGLLVDIVRTASNEGGVIRPDGSPRIRPLPKERLRELMGDAADWAREVKGKEVFVQPPATIAAHVMARGQWTHIRPLDGVVGYPVLTPAGDVLLRPGYDSATRLIYEPSVDVAVPERPSREDARRAADFLLERVVDFPFAAPAHRSAWLAALLTPLARPAIEGPTPLNLIDANSRGAGKTLLADIVGAVVLGRPLSRRTAPDEPAEWNKAMLGIVIAADPMVLIDNVTAVLKADALDAVLTGTEFRGRLLGRNEELSLPVRTVFFATANNAMLSADLVRRSVHIRLEAREERPELRTGFRWPDLLGSAANDRGALLAAALTILRAYTAAGRPAVDMLPMGSYEAWSRVVRAPLVWSGLEDPARTQEGLRESADTEREGVAALLRAWRRSIGDRAVTAAELLRRAEGAGEDALRDAILGLVDGATGGLPTVQRLGYKLKRIRGRVVAGLALERAEEHTKAGATWKVQRVGDDGEDSDDVSNARARDWDENSIGQGTSSPSSLRHRPGVSRSREPGEDDGDEVDGSGREWRT